MRRPLIRVLKRATRFKIHSDNLTRPLIATKRRRGQLFRRRFTSAPSLTKDEEEDLSQRSALYRFLHKSSIVAKPGYNRWLVPFSSVGIHICIGSVYAWSIFNPPLTKEFGVLVSAADDWSLTSVVWIFSVAIVNLGLSAAIGGSWLEKVGPRMVGMLAANLWGGGFLLGGLGVMTHQLPLLYLGYGVLGGWGLGLGYVSPVSTLLRWFPDRRGMATGLAIMGFGGGAMIAAPVKSKLLEMYYKAPTYLGPTADITMKTDETGRQFAQVGQDWKEVVVADQTAIANCPLDLSEGVYLVGTGNTGAAMTFFTLGAAYWAIMNAAALSYRVPQSGWKPEGWTPPVSTEGKVSTNQPSVHVDTALLTPQFWCLWTVLCLNVTAGIGVLGVAKTMMSDIFGTKLDMVDAAFAAGYVSTISVFNMGGRIFWASASDYLGRKNTYNIFFCTQIPLYLSIPYAAQMVSVNPSVTPLVMFYASTMIIFSMYGGGFSTIPAYLADVFGEKYVGAIHGRLLTAWSVAGVAGPVAIAQLRERSMTNAIHDLAQIVPPEEFALRFGSPLENLDALVQAKTVSISKLLEICPPGTIDPTSGVYDTTMQTMSALLIVALGANNCVRRVDPKYLIKD